MIMPTILAATMAMTHISSVEGEIWKEETLEAVLKK